VRGLGGCRTRQIRLLGGRKRLATRGPGAVFLVEKLQRPLEAAPSAPIVARDEGTIFEGGSHTLDESIVEQRLGNFLSENQENVFEQGMGQLGVESGCGAPCEAGGLGALEPPSCGPPIDTGRVLNRANGFYVGERLMLGELLREVGIRLDLAANCGPRATNAAGHLRRRASGGKEGQNLRAFCIIENLGSAGAGTGGRRRWRRFVHTLVSLGVAGDPLREGEFVGQRVGYSGRGGPISTKKLVANVNARKKP
jgi:hypothetical protein